MTRPIPLGGRKKKKRSNFSSYNFTHSLKGVSICTILIQTVGLLFEFSKQKFGRWLVTVQHLDLCCGYRIPGLVFQGREYYPVIHGVQYLGPTHHCDNGNACNIT